MHQSQKPATPEHNVKFIVNDPILIIALSTAVLIAAKIVLTPVYAAVATDTVIVILVQVE